MILLSLIMIVKNEVSLLPGFLKHHASLFDEMIIVDTGSQDQTCGLIKAAGATLIETIWQDDFSAARNQGLRRARGRWLMLLDADERLAARDFQLLRRFLEKAPSAVYLQNTINYFPGANHLEWQPVSGAYPQEEKGQTGYFIASRAGLFPNRMNLEFSGRVHESILPSAQVSGLEIRSLEIPIHHYGYVQSPELNQTRRDNYRHLVQKKMDDRVGDWSAMLEMASIHLEDDQPAEAKKLLALLAEGPQYLPAVIRGRFLWARFLNEAGDTAAASQILSDSTEMDPSFLFGWLEWLRLEAKLGHWSVVAEILRKAKKHFPKSSPLLMREELLLLVRTGQIPQATVLARKLAESCPQWQEIGKLAQKLENMADFGKPN